MIHFRGDPTLIENMTQQDSSFPSQLTKNLLDYKITNNPTKRKKLYKYNQTPQTHPT